MHCVFCSLVSYVTCNDSIDVNDKYILFSDTNKEQLTFIHNYHLLYQLIKQEHISNLLDITSDATELSLCYDLLYVNQDKMMIPYDLFWNCMKLLNYNFAYLSNTSTIFHRLLYQFSCVIHKNQMTIHEALLLIMVLKNKCRLLPCNEFINDFIHFLTVTGNIDSTCNNKLFGTLFIF